MLARATKKEKSFKNVVAPPSRVLLLELEQVRKLPETRVAQLSLNDRTSMLAVPSQEHLSDTLSAMKFGLLLSWGQEAA